MSNTNQGPPSGSALPAGWSRQRLMQKSSHQHGAISMKGPHICDCLCALCERLGTGAFGPQPDGSAGVVVVRRRGVRRPKHYLGHRPSLAMGASKC